MKELQSTCSQALSGPEFRVEPFDWTPDVRLEAFGSTRQGTALQSSDLDVRMTFEQFEVHGQQRQLKYLRGIEASPGKRFEVVQLIEARLPVLRLRFDGHLHVDLSMGGTLEGGGARRDEDGFGIDQPLTALADAAIDADAVRRFVRLVKAFAKENKLVNAYFGLPSSTTWTCLALVFLQLEGCVPSGQEVAQGVATPHRLWPVQLSVGLLHRFLGFVEDFGERPHKVSTWQGTSFPTRSWTCSGQPAHPLFVEHPDHRRNSVNLAQSLSWSGWLQATRCCGDVRRELTPKAGSSPTSQEAAAIVAAARLFGGVNCRACDAPLSDDKEGGSGAKRRRISQSDADACDQNGEKCCT